MRDPETRIDWSLAYGYEVVYTGKNSGNMYTLYSIAGCVLISHSHVQELPAWWYI